MARKKAVSQPVEAQTADNPVHAEVASVAESFSMPDVPLAEAAEPSFDYGHNGHHEPSPVVDQPQAAEGKKTWVKRPDPFGAGSILLSKDPSGPRMRLFRNERDQVMAIQFDEKPEAKIIQKLRDARFEWINKDRVWTKPLDPESKWRVHYEAEKLFQDIGNEIRKDRGLAPQKAEESIPM